MRQFKNDGKMHSSSHTFLIPCRRRMKFRQSRRVYEFAHVCMCVCFAWLVNIIFQDSNDGYFSCLIYKIIILRKRALWSKIKGNARSAKVISREHCKHDISSYKTWILFILIMWMRYSQTMNFIGYSRDQSLSDVTGGGNTEFLNFF